MDMIKTAGELITKAQKEIDCVNPVEAKTLFDNSNDAVIVDVRETKNFDESSLEDSINIPRGLLEMLIEKNCQNSETLILTHCAGGGRASLAALTLKEWDTQMFTPLQQLLKRLKRSSIRQSFYF